MHGRLIGKRRENEENDSSETVSGNETLVDRELWTKVPIQEKGLSSIKCK